MRVIHVITRLIVGGAQENTIASVLGLQQKPGLDVRFISGPDTGPEGSLVSAFASCPAMLTLLPELVRPVHPWKDALAWRRLTRIFRERQPDIVHTHSGKAGFLGRLAAARAGVPIIVHTIHGPSFGPFQGPLANWLFRVGRTARGQDHHTFCRRRRRHDPAISRRRHRPARTIHENPQRLSACALICPPPMIPRCAPAGASRPEDIVIGKIARLFKLRAMMICSTWRPALRAQIVPRIKFLLVGDGAWRGRLDGNATDPRAGKEFHFHRPGSAR